MVKDCIDNNHMNISPDRIIKMMNENKKKKPIKIDIVAANALELNQAQLNKSNAIIRSNSAEL